MMIATECPDKQALRALAIGQMSGNESETLFEHVAECPMCRGELDGFEQSDDPLLASLRSQNASKPFDDEPACELAVAKALAALALAPMATCQESLPKLIGEYEILRPLGQGGMGRVYLARHTKLGREVAVKVLANHRLGDAKMRERFEAEMRAVGRLSHPNIVTAHDAREVDSMGVLITEYIDGLDMSQVVQRTGPLQYQDACEIVRLVAVALQYTSQQGFVHRDVKPSNIMLSRAGEVKLLDLGLARLQLDYVQADNEAAANHDSENLTATGQAMGSADYIAPEQVTDSRRVDSRADIYSLGCTLFKLLSGVAPFADAQHQTTFAKMTAHVSTQPPRLQELVPALPKALTQLVTQMLAKQPADRPESAAAVARRLETFSRGCDLVALAERVQKLKPKESIEPQPAVVAQPIPLMRRKVLLYKAIGAAFFALLVGLCLGVILTIKYPDGTMTNIEVPEGSTISMAVGAAEPVDSVPAKSSGEKEIARPNWVRYDPYLLPKLRENGRVVVLHFTADWCLNCNTNQAKALDRPAVRELMREHRVVPMLADWTYRSKEISAALEQLGTLRLPLTVIYPSGTGSEPILLSDLFTEEQFVDKLTKAVSQKSPDSESLADYRIQPGDLLSISIPYILSESVTIFVMDDGTVSLPLVVPIQVADKTVLEIEQAIDDAYLVSHVVKAGQSRATVSIVKKASVSSSQPDQAGGASESDSGEEPGIENPDPFETRKQALLENNVESPRPGFADNPQG